MKTGRPPKPENERRANVLRVCLTEQERREINGAAGKAGQDASGWGRGVLLKAARKTLSA